MITKSRGLAVVVVLVASLGFAPSALATGGEPTIGGAHTQTKTVRPVQPKTRGGEKR